MTGKSKRNIFIRVEDVTAEGIDLGEMIIMLNKEEHKNLKRKDTHYAFHLVSEYDEMVHLLSVHEGTEGMFFVN